MTAVCTEDKFYNLLVERYKCPELIAACVVEETIEFNDDFLGVMRIILADPDDHLGYLVAGAFDWRHSQLTAEFWSPLFWDMDARPLLHVRKRSFK